MTIFLDNGTCGKRTCIAPGGIGFDLSLLTSATISVVLRSLGD
jgi:hypothetical protein